MKKILLLVLVMLSMYGTAHGAAVDASGSWLMTIPPKIPTAFCISCDYGEPTTMTFSISVDALGNVNHIQTSQPIGYQYGTDGIYHTIKTRPPNSGTLTTTGVGIYNIDANATSGVFVGTSGKGAGYLAEIVIHTYDYDEATDSIDNGVMASIIDIGPTLTYPNGIIYSTVNLYFYATRVVPIPAGFWLLASALVGLAAFRKRTKR